MMPTMVFSRLLAALSGALLAVSTCGSAFAADGKKEAEPKAGAKPPVDVAALVALADPKGELIEVTLGPAMLKVLNRSITQNQPEAATILRDLRRIEAVVASIRKDDVKKAREQIDAAAVKLEEQGWERTALVRQAGQHIRVYTRPSEDVIDGLVVFVLNDEGDDRQLIYSFIDGRIQLDQLPLVGSLQVPGLNAIPSAVNADTAAGTTTEVKEMRAKEDES